MQYDIHEHSLMPDLSEFDTIVTGADGNASSFTLADSRAQWAMAFNLTAHYIRSMGRDNDISQLECPPDYMYYGGSGSSNGGGDLGVDLHDEADLSVAEGSNVGGGTPWHDRLRYVVDVYVVSALCAFGFIGNMLSIIVLRRYRLTGRRDVQNACTSCLLQALAALNTVYLAACLVIQPAKTVIELSPRLLPRSIHDSFAYIEPYAWAAASIAQTASVWMLVVVTADRYIAVCRPLKSHLRTLSRAKSAIIAVIAISILYNTPSFFERHTVELDCAGVRVAIVRQTALRSHYIYFVIYKTALFFLFRTAGPLVGLTVLNVRLMAALQELRRRRRRLKCSTVRARRRETVTVMLIAVVTMFIACELPDLALRIAATVIGFKSKTHLGDNIDENAATAAAVAPPDDYVASNDKFDETLALRCVNVVSNCLLTANSALSFVVYCAVVRKFRDTLMTLCQFGASSRDRTTTKTSMREVSEADPFANVGRSAAAAEVQFDLRQAPASAAIALVVEVASYVNADIVTTNQLQGSIEIEDDCR